MGMGMGTTQANSEKLYHDMAVTTLVRHSK